MSLFTSSAHCIIKIPVENKAIDFETHKFKLDFLLNSMSLIDGKTNVTLNVVNLSDLIGVQEFRETPYGSSGEKEANNFSEFPYRDSEACRWRADEHNEALETSSEMKEAVLRLVEPISRGIFL